MTADTPMKGVSYLYVFSIPGGPSKIGRSMAVDRRKKDIEREKGCEVFVAGSWAIGQKIAMTAENYIHWKLRDKHIAHEWFSIDSEEACNAVEEALSLEFDPRYIVPSISLVEKQIRYGWFYQVKFPDQTKERIAGVISQPETHSDFIREAVERELERREAGKAV